MKIAKFIFLYIFNFLFFSISVVFSFTPVDSLRQLMETADDKTKMELYDKIFRYYYNVSPAQSLPYAEEELEFAQSVNNEEGIVMATINIGAFYWSQYNFETVLDYNLQALNLAEKIGYIKGILLATNNIGAVYNELSKNEKALEYYTKNYNYIINNKLDTISSYSYYFAICLNNLGQIYSEMGDFQKSLEYLNQSLDINRKSNNNFLIIHTLVNIGVNYIEIEDFSLAEEHLLEAMQMCKTHKMTNELIGTYLNLGMLYTKTENFKAAQSYLEEGISASKEILSGKLLSYGYLYYSEYYEKINVLDSALSYYKKYKTIEDSLFNENMNQKVAELQVRFETEKQITEIEIQKKTILRKNITISILVLTSFIICLLLVVLWKQFRDKKIAYDKIVQQNLEQLRLEKEQPATEELLNEKELTETTESDKAMEMKYLQFLEQFKTQQLFLKPQLTIETLAKQYDTNRTYLSQLIHKYSNLNFNQFLNKYRIEYARNMLSSPQYNHLSIEGIAQSSGFNSKTTFNNAFKYFIGITPSYFRDSIKEKQNIA